MCGGGAKNKLYFVNRALPPQVSFPGAIAHLAYSAWLPAARLLLRGPVSPGTLLGGELRVRRPCTCQPSPRRAAWDLELSHPPGRGDSCLGIYLRPPLMLLHLPPSKPHQRRDHKTLFVLF